MSHDAAESWSTLYSKMDDISYPAEGVIRIFKGSFPELTMPKPKAGDCVCDVGCGDGRHLPLFHSLGMDVSAVEITDDITKTLRHRMQGLRVPAKIHTGHAGDLPFANETFHYLLSWNSCYYMSFGGLDFQKHVDEMARVLKPGAWIVCSIPKKSSFIFRDSVEHRVPGYRVIKDDYFGLRNGEVMRCMDSREDLEDSFSTRFDEFCHADLDMDWFGLSYRWHVFAARRSA